MSTLRPGRCYHHITQQPWTRVSKRRPRRSYVKGVPVGKIHQFEVGSKTARTDTAKVFHLVTGQECQLRSNCLEAARQTALRYMAKTVGETNFFMKVRVYPHHVLRENALATGAGADRFSEGMSRPFGKPAGSAARVCVGQKIITIWAPPGKEADARMAFNRARKKLPGMCHVVAE